MEIDKEILKNTNLFNWIKLNNYKFFSVDAINGNDIYVNQNGLKKWSDLICDYNGSK